MTRHITKEEKNEYFRQYRAKNREKIRKYNREYNRKHRKLHGYHAEEKWTKKNPEKRKVHELLREAVRLGIVDKSPCKVCGAKKSVAHHPDYSKPLEVIWLCAIHHRQAHYTIKEKSQ